MYLRFFSYHLIGFLLLAVLPIALPLTVLTTQQQQEIRQLAAGNSTPIVTPTSVSSAILTEKSSYGFTFHKNFDSNALAEYLDLHAGWVRIQEQWDEIETSLNTYNWSSLDEMVKRANDNNIKVDFGIWRAPKFRAGLRCAEDNNTLFGPSVGTDYVASPDVFAHFAGLVASRYNGTNGHGRIDAIEVLNEFPFSFYDPSNPNAHNPCTDPKYYLPILRGAYTAIKQNSLGNPILVGMDAIFSQTSYYQRWLNNFYDLGARNYFDFVSLHYYNSRSSPDPSITSGVNLSFKDAMNQIYDVMQNNGDGNKYIWVTEFGWPTQYSGNSNTDYFVSPNQQAQNLQYVLTIAKAAGFIENLFYYTINTQDSYPASYGDCWNDIKVNCSNKPNYSNNLQAYTTLKKFIAANPHLPHLPGSQSRGMDLYPLPTFLALVIGIVGAMLSALLLKDRWKRKESKTRFK